MITNKPLGLRLLHEKYQRTQYRREESTSRVENRRCFDIVSAFGVCLVVSHWDFSDELNFAVETNIGHPDSYRTLPPNRKPLAWFWSGWKGINRTRTRLSLPTGGPSASVQMSRTFVTVAARRESLSHRLQGCMRKAQLLRQMDGLLLISVACLMAS